MEDDHDDHEPGAPGARVPSVMVSFDIDGTMEFGDPAGPVTIDLVRTAKGLGYVVGCASDRPLSSQRRLWSEAAVDMDFIGGKHDLHVQRDLWTCQRMVHIGDTDVDRHYALLAGFEFVHVDELPPVGTSGWIF